MACRPGDKEEEKKGMTVHGCMSDSPIRVGLTTARFLEIHKAFGVMVHAFWDRENPFCTSNNRIKYLFECIISEVLF